jgi:enoyl-CoA hydratase/carnithine racemase
MVKRIIPPNGWGIKFDSRSCLSGLIVRSMDESIPFNVLCNLSLMRDSATLTDMKTINLILEHNQTIATIEFNRPHVLNALNREAMTAFAQAVKTVADDANIRVVILTGAGDQAFCSGGDLNELSTLTTESEAREFSQLMTSALAELEALPIPVIGAINGYALGGGSEIALACDMRIVDQSAKLGFVQARLALTPGWGAGNRLLWAVGYAQAMELLLRASPLSADDLVRLRLVNQVTETGQALATAKQFAQTIVGWDADVVRGIKRLLRAGVELPASEARQVEADLFPPLWAGQAHLDAVEQFLTKQRQKQIKD